MVCPFAQALYDIYFSLTIIHLKNKMYQMRQKSEMKKHKTYIERAGGPVRTRTEIQFTFKRCVLTLFRVNISRREFF